LFERNRPIIIKAGIRTNKDKKFISCKITPNP